MFFKKKREAAKAQAEEVKQDTLRAFDAKFEEAQASHDPADKILKLEDQKKAIDLLVQAAHGKIISESKGKWMGAYFGTTIGANLAIDAVSVLLTGVPVTTLIMIPSIIAGWWAGDKRVQKTQERLLKENAPFFAQLQERKERADVAIEKTMATDMRDFAESPKFEELLQRVPSLREKFAEAYKKHILEGGLSGKPEPKKKDGGFKL